MAIMAELGDIGVADILNMLAIRRQTGRLTVRVDGDEVSFYLGDGRLVLVTSSNLSLRLGQTLRRLGALTIQQLHQALREQAQADSRMPLGRFLLARGWVTDEVLSRCAEEQAIAAVARVIAAERGSLVYTGGVTPPTEIQVVPLRADYILIEATRRMDELSRLQADLPAPHTPLLLAGRIDDVADGLTDAEVLVALALADRVASVADLAKSVALDESELSQAILGLCQRGLLEIMPTPPASAPAVAASGQEPMVDGAVPAPVPLVGPPAADDGERVVVLGDQPPAIVNGFRPLAGAIPVAGAA